MMIAEEEIPAIFTDEAMENLAKSERLPPAFVLHRALFARSVREAMRVYLPMAHQPSRSQVRKEISCLLRAAELALTPSKTQRKAAQRFERVAALLARLSPISRDLLNERGTTPGFRTTNGGEGDCLPHADALLDLATRQEACQRIVRFAIVGGGYREGRVRKHASGRVHRTYSWCPEVHAPVVVKNPERLEAERHLYPFLRITWREVMGFPAPATARHAEEGYRDLNPFARMLRGCLKLAGSSHVDVVELINGCTIAERKKRLQRRREKGAEKRLTASNS